MSSYTDYKTYKKYLPQYASWKKQQDLKEAKKQEYIKRHPEIINQNDIEKGKSIIRAIDIMDDYSQKRAEDMEVLTESATEYINMFLMFLSMGLTTFIAGKEPIKSKLNKFAKGNKNATTLIPITLGIGSFVLPTLFAFPISDWAAKTEVGASRKGRFEAMRKDLNNPNIFANLTEEQKEQVKENAKNIHLPKEKNKITQNFKDILDLFKEKDTYTQQRKQFEKELEHQTKHINDTMTPQEINNAKKDKQILKYLVEKIDIASQDYTENAELALTFLTMSVFAFSGLLNYGYQALINKIMPKNNELMKTIGSIASVVMMIGTAIVTASMQKDASKIGRFKAKQELLNNPNQLIYVDDEKINTVQDSEVQVKQNKKQNMSDFLKNIWKDNKEYKQYLKTTAQEEKKYYKALENIKLTDEQAEEAQRIQRNTFKTFNKVDEKSQKYSEGVEALGKTIQTPLSLFSGLIASTVALPTFIKDLSKSKNKINFVPIAKYFSIVMLASIPPLFINAICTKEQKNASRVADMLALNELDDYRNFK